MSQLKAPTMLHPITVVTDEITILDGILKINYTLYNNP